MSDDLQSKQAYLRENVLEMGYDADEFMTFLQTKKGENGLDLNNWSMNELITVVDEFVNNKKVKPNPQPEQNEEKEEKNEEENNKEINQEYINNNENNIDEKSNNVNINNIQYNSIDDGDEYLGKCQANEITSFSNVDNIRVKLSSPKKVEGKMFQKAFISYKVNTEPFNFEMNKRYSDFLWLKKMLSLIYINCVVPPLCKKNFTDRFTDYLIEKRMRSIEKFMDGILEHPLMRNSEIVTDFLSVINTKEYNKKIEKYNKIKKSPAFVRQIKTMNGEVNIGINNEKEIYFDNIKNYVKGHYILLQKITKGYKSIMNIMQQLSNKMKDVSKLWKQVFDISIKYSDGYNTSGTYHIMSKLMEDWSEIQKSQMKVINIDIREYFRYVKNEFNGLKEMTERVQNSKSTYIKFKEKLQKTKETLFEKQDPETWQLKDEDKQNVVNLLKNKELAFSRMLPQDTLKLKEYKQFYGCLLNSLIAEFERIRKINNKRHKKNTEKFVRELSGEITNLHVTLADRQCEFRELKDDMEDYNKIGGFMKQVEKVEENLGEKDDNNNIINIENNNEIIEENNIDKVENNIESNNINNHVENNNINNDITKDFEKLEHSDFVENNKKENNKDKDKNKNKNKKKDDDKKQKKSKEKKLENKKSDAKEEKKEIIVNNNIDKNIKEEKKDIIINNIENNINNNIPKEEKKIEKKEIINNKNGEKIENKNPVEFKQEIKEEKEKKIEIKQEKKEEIKNNIEIKEIKKEENNIELNNKDKKNENELNEIVEKKEEYRKEIKVKEAEKPEENKDKKNEEDKKEDTNKK